MEKLTNTTRPGVLSFIGHTPGFWPQESLVCIALNEKVSARPFASTTPADPARNSPTHARDLRPDGRHQCCIHHLRRLHQRNHPTPDRPTPTPAASPRSPESSPSRASPSGTASSSETRPPPPTTAAPAPTSPLPVSSIQTSAVNADFMYRGSFVEPTTRITLPAAARKQHKRPPSNEATG
jgi:hypothetical protein